MFEGKKVDNLNIEDLKQILVAGRRAVQYAWDHYEELEAREATYTLYGPMDYAIGAAIPGHSVSKSSRKLTFNTKRKTYIVYRLDSDYKLLRAELVFNCVEYNVTYHCFELDGILYACPFAYNRKKTFSDEIIALGYKDGEPCFYGNLSKERVLARFYEYVSAEKVHVTEYSYRPLYEYTLHGYPTDPNAPLGELNSPAQKSVYEEKPLYTDFSKFFDEDEPEETEESAILPLADWIDRILNTDIPEDVKAFCFNLYEEGNGSWSMELVGAGRFDPEDQDWPCDEVTDFGSANDSYQWEMDIGWEEALSYIVKELKEYLENGRYAKILKSRSGVGAGFVDGDLEILYQETAS